MPYPVTPQILADLTARQRAAYRRALEHKRSDLDPLVVDRVRDAWLYYRTIPPKPPQYLSKIQVMDTFDDGTEFTRCYVVVPRDDRLQ